MVWHGFPPRGPPGCHIAPGPDPTANRPRGGWVRPHGGRAGTFPRPIRYPMMPAANEVARLLDDIETRQQQVIEELDALILRIEAVIAEWTEPGKKTAPSSQGPA